MCQQQPGYCKDGSHLGIEYLRVMISGVNGTVIGHRDGVGFVGTSARVDIRAVILQQSSPSALNRFADLADHDIYVLARGSRHDTSLASARPAGVFMTSLLNVVNF